ncbi:MAG: restriction endonuclease [Alphaproteobacteria bacterium]|nr:restriction endonuclease [Alphaproteobacteria bacterium]
MTFLDAAERVLKEAGEPLHADAITERVLTGELIDSHGKTPAATMHSMLAVAVRKKGEGSRFMRTAPGTFGLRAWAPASDAEPVAAPDFGGVKVPHYPTNAEVRAVLPVWDGVPRPDITGMRRAISKVTGTPQENLDWKQPDQWIPARLEGAAQALAMATWTGTQGLVNPRHTNGVWLVATNYELLRPDDQDVMRLTDRGRDFLAHPAGNVVQDIDEAEGLIRLLGVVAEQGPAASTDFLEAWMLHLQRVSRIRMESSARSRLYYRLRNLEARGLVVRKGRSWGITEEGLATLGEAQVQSDASGTPLDAEIRRLLQQQKAQVQEAMQALLQEMDPYAFERLIGRLLDVMDYRDVEVTSPSNDKGVDVVGDIELGITRVREVIQVKRQRGNIRRPVLDALRGSLHRWQAMRGTIITTGGFSKGTQAAAFERGAAPITLIDGEKLIELLIEHNIGVVKKEVVLWELDASAFEEEE